MNDIKMEGYTKIEHDDGRIEFVPISPRDSDYHPKKGEKFYYVHDTGEAVVRTPYFQGNFDDSRIAFHNCFPSMDMAEKAAQLMRRSNAIIRACLLVDPDVDVDDITNLDVDKWWPMLSYDKWKPCRAIYVDRIGVAFVSTKKKAEQACALLTKWGVK